MSTNLCNVTELSTARRYVAINYVFAVVASVACLATIVLVITAKAHRTYIHRLTLYLAIASFLSAVSLGLSVVPVNLADPISLRDGWNSTCVVFGFLVQYFGLSSALATIWICINVFLLAICQVKLGQRKFEIAGPLIIFLAPALVSWVPAVNGSYGLTTVWCWIQGRCYKGWKNVAGMMLGASVGPILVMYLLSLAMIAAIAVRLFAQLQKKPFKGTHRAALKEVLPLLIYPGTYSLVLAAAAFSVLYFSLEDTLDASDAVAVVLNVFQAIRVLLPLSFVAHPSVRRKVCALLKLSCAVKRPREEYETASRTGIFAGGREDGQLDTCTELSTHYTEQDPILT